MLTIVVWIHSGVHHILAVVSKNLVTGVVKKNDENVYYTCNLYWVEYHNIIKLT